MSRSADRRTSAAVVTLLAVAFSSWTSTSIAQVDAAGATRPPVLTTTEDGLVKGALAHNPELRAGQWERNIAEAQVSTASALNNPVLRLEWLHAQEGSPIESGWGARLSWTPPQPTEWSARRAQARARTTEVEHELLERAADLEASIRTGCATADALAEQLSIAARALETRRAIVSILASRVERGASTRLELNAATLSTARTEQERDEIVIARESVLRRLASIAGLPAGTRLDLAPGVPADASPSPGDAGEGDARSLEARALVLRPLFRADAARAEQASQALRAEKTRRYPWFSLSSLPRVRVTDAQSRPVDLMFGIDLTLPIFDGNGGRIAAAEAEQHRQNELHAVHVSTVRRDIDVAREETTRRRELLARFKRTIEPILEEHATLLRDAMEGRQLDFLALLSAEDVVVRTQREYVEARLSYRKSRIQLLRASGALTAGTVRAQNRLGSVEWRSNE
jgi:outer membrane protein TolC